MISITLHKLSSRNLTEYDGMKWNIIAMCVIFCDSQPLILLVAKNNVLNVINMGCIQGFHSQKPLILLLPFTNSSTNYPPNISLWSKNSHVTKCKGLMLSALITKATQMLHVSDSLTDLQQIFSWPATVGSPSRPAGCRTLTECFPRYWTGLWAGRVYRDLLSSGTGPGEPLHLQDMDKKNQLIQLITHEIRNEGCWARYDIG